MSYDPFSALPAAQRETVRTALSAAFGSARADMISPVGGGASGAFPFEVLIGDRRYLVRLEGPAGPLRNPHQYESMRIASAAGIAPYTHYADEVAGVAVTDFVEERPLNTFPGGRPALAEAVGAMLNRLQRTPPFPRFVEYPEIVGRLWRWVRQTGLFAPGVLDPCSEHLARVCEGYFWDTTASVSAHNDSIPRNILFDGQRLWLIDWESAYRNDPLVDVAITLDNFAPSPELEQVLLRAWLGHDEPSASLAGRLTQVRALTRLYYAGVFLSASAKASGALGDRDLSVPTVAAFGHAVHSGEMIPGTPEATHMLGKLFLASFMTGDPPPDLHAAD